MQEKNFPKNASMISTTQKGPILDSKYILRKELGFGLTSKVFEVLDVQTGELKAAKIFESKASKIFIKENNILQKISSINSPSNIKFYEAGFGPLKSGANEEDKMYIILEYGTHGNLFDIIANTKHGFSEDVSKYIFYKILTAVNTLHNNGICHRDIKPENILITKDYELKLCDFGFSVSFIKNNEPRKLSKPIGTHYYCAPEIIENKQYDGDKIDIFSLGATLFTLVTKKFGFYEAKVNNLSLHATKILYKFIKNKQYDRYWDLIENTFHINNLNKSFKDLFVKMVAYNPDERPSIEDIKNDEWLKEIRMANEEELGNLHAKLIQELKGVIA